LVSLVLENNYTTTTTQLKPCLKELNFMIPQLFVESIDLGDGRNITIETGRLAKQADGSVVVRIGKTVILGTVVS
jgi:exosome complex RNA-binding protein Rrp42 (RNase PH superfamily)